MGVRNAFFVTTQSFVRSLLAHGNQSEIEFHYMLSKVLFLPPVSVLIVTMKSNECQPLTKEKNEPVNRNSVRHGRISTEVSVSSIGGVENNIGVVTENTLRHQYSIQTSERNVLLVSWLVVRCYFISLGFNLPLAKVEN